MDQSSFIFQLTRKCAVLTVVVMAMLTVSQPLFAFDEPQKVEVASENGDEEEASFRLNAPTISAPSQQQVHHVFYEIMVIEFDSGNDVFPEYAEVARSESYRKFLFRQVISPNAP